MTTYYTFWFGDRNENDIYSHSLYKTFEKVCEIVDEEIIAMLTIADEDNVNYTPPNIEELRKEMEHNDDIEYYRTDDEVIFHIRKMVVDEED